MNALANCSGERLSTLLCIAALFCRSPSLLLSVSSWICCLVTWKSLREARVADGEADVMAEEQPGLQKIANAKIPKAQRRYMQTGLFFGHHIGLAVGDPSLAHAPLAEGCVFTVEPWYYNHDEQIAVFVEDVVLVTADGAVNLTAALPREPEQLEKLVGR